MPEAERPRIAWFTPLRPVESGISHYNEELLPVLATAWQIDVYVDGYRPTHLATGDTLRVSSARSFRRRHRANPYDAVVYQLGNSRAHAYMYRTALEVPGLTVLHDTMLHHLILSMLLTRSRRQYRRLMERHYGDRGLAAAERVLRGHLPKSLFDFPLSEDVVEASRQVAVHSEFARANVLRHSPRACVGVLPMGIPLPPMIAREEARRRLGLPEHEFLLASITHVNPYKRLDMVLRVLARLRTERPVRMVIAGSVAPLVPLERYVAALRLEGAVERLGFVDDATARLVVAACDVCVNLRFPTAGETSASLLRLMGGGRPVLVTGAGSFSELHDDA
ncbi:MAG TPA: glycosyltransferase, partial [Thermomicrobiaceae bacterium]|nr:glycosyltransferase [Thermomicrobiaceae bacterium]